MKTILPLAALAAAFAVAPASARPATVVTRIVPVADIDLASRSGVGKLDRRIHRAAVSLCGTTVDFDLHGRNAIARCVADAKVAAAPARAQAIAQRAATIRVAAR